MIQKIRVGLPECSLRPRVSAGWCARGGLNSPAAEQWYSQEGVPRGKQHTHMLAHVHTHVHILMLIHTHARSYVYALIRTRTRSYPQSYVQSLTHVYTHTSPRLLRGLPHCLTGTVVLLSALSPPPGDTGKRYGVRELAVLTPECLGPRQVLSKHGSKWESQQVSERMSELLSE